MEMKKINSDMRHAMGEFMKTDRMHRCIVEKLVKSLGIHRSQHMVLMYIYRSEGRLNQKDIAEKFEISAAAVSVTLRKLEDAGYIERTATEEDSRYNNLTINKKGMDIVKKSEEMFEYIDNLAFADFSEEEIETMLSYLKKMQNSLRNAESKL